ncbi:MAG: PAS domain S-box protein [Anaerolineae bacterium]|nr:PAS domain S-box protein [Anaerolineae bacterium]
MTELSESPIPAELLEEIAALREEVAKLQNEKAEMELLMQMTAEHSDRVADELYSAVEETQRESEERFRVITNTVPVPIVVSRIAEDMIVYANPAAGELLGTTSEDLLGRSVAEFYGNTKERQKILTAIAEQGVVDNWQVQGKQDGEVYFWAAVFIRPLTFHAEPCLLEAYHDLTAHKQAQLEQARLQQEIIEAQQKAIQELSTPVIPVIDQIIVMPLIGNIDSMRARDLTRQLLAGISEHRAKVVILDITGVPLVDSGVANYLTKAIRAAQLKGARTIVTGISEAVAETIVDLGIDWSEITTLSDLRTGLLVALRSLGKRLL